MLQESYLLIEHFVSAAASANRSAATRRCEHKP
jgi:hypothetical protein